MKKFKIFMITGLVFAILSAFTIIVNAKNDKNDKKVIDENYKMGLKFTTKKSNKIDTLNIKEKSVLPNFVDYSLNMPSVGDQGQQGSCVGWAHAYYKSYQESLDMQWGNVMFSPSFIYNQINNGVDEGSTMEAALLLLKNKGDCRLSTMPYDWTDYLTQPNQTQLNEANHFKAEEVYYLNPDIDMLKTWLFNNDCFTIAIPIYSDYYYNGNDGYYDNNNGYLIAYHALCCVGYDDTTNYLKFINSWGNSWGENGYGYISYNLWNQFVSNNQAMSYCMTDLDSEFTTSTPTNEPTQEPTNSPTPTEEPTNEPTPTNTITPTDEPTNSPTPTATDKPTATPTSTQTASSTPTNSPTPVITATPTNSPTPPKYKYTLKFKDARIVSKGNSSGAGNQWSVAVKNESKTTMLMYYRKNIANPIITTDKSMQTNYNGCYIGVKEIDKPASKSDHVKKIISHLNDGDNVIYITVKDKQLGGNYWSKWKFVINRIAN